LQVDGPLEKLPGATLAYRKFFEILLVFFFLVYPTSCRIIFQTFQCEVIDGRSYIVEDHSTLCDDSTERMSYVVYAAVMVFVFPIGVPIWFFVLLYRKRDILSAENDDKGINSSEEEDTETENITDSGKFAKPKELNFLYRSYKPMYYYFETLEMMRKLIQTSLIVFFTRPGTDLQTGISLQLAFIFGLHLSIYNPYAYDSDTHLAVLSQVFLGIAAVTIIAKPAQKTGVSIFAVLLTILVLVSIFTAEIFMISEDPEDEIVKDEIVQDNSKEVANDEDPTASDTSITDQKVSGVPSNGFAEVQVERV